MHEAMVAEQPLNEEHRYFKAQAQAERKALPPEERVLTEVDNLNRYRLSSGLHAQWTLDETLKNLIPYVKEGGMPDAVHTVRHPYRETGEVNERGQRLKSYMYLGRTAVQSAASGYQFHVHEAAIKRVDIEVDEALDHEANLRPGYKKVFISPRMSRADANKAEAEAEHLAVDDAIRVTEAITDKDGNVVERAVQSLLVEDIPLEAWVSMLQDPENIFGKPLIIDNPESALSIMKTHRYLEVPSGELPGGPVDIVEAVIPYIKDESLKNSVGAQVKRFREKQEELHARAENIAKRWLDFEVELADSMYNERATSEVQTFIEGMNNRWSPQAKALLAAHETYDGGYRMTRELAVMIEKAKQNTLLVRAGVVSGSKKVLKQLSQHEVDSIYRAEMTLQTAYASGMHQQRRALEMNLDNEIASKRVKAGGGCAGSSKGDFGEDGIDGVDHGGAEDSGSWHGGKTYKNSKCYSCKKVKSEVGACHICKDCVHNPSKREREFRQYLIDRARKGKGGNYLFSIKNTEVQPMLKVSSNTPKEKFNAKADKEKGVTKLAFTVPVKS